MKIKTLLIAALMLVLFVLTLAQAATKNPPPGAPGYTPVVLSIPGSYTSTASGVVKFKAPAGYRIVTANANSRTVSGTNPTLKVNIKNGIYSTYSGTVSTAATPKDLTAATDTTITDEGSVAVDLTIGGTNTPTFTDLTVFLLLKRL